MFDLEDLRRRTFGHNRRSRRLSTHSYDTDQIADQHARSLLGGRKSSPRCFPQLAMSLVLLLIAIRVHRCV